MWPCSSHPLPANLNLFPVAAKHARIAGGERRNATACIPVVDAEGEMSQMAADGRSLGIGRQAEEIQFPHSQIRPELAITTILPHQTVQTFLNPSIG